MIRDLNVIGNFREVIIQGINELSRIEIFAVGTFMS